jgi:polar amino acid transport system substrate-binding protein
MSSSYRTYFDARAARVTMLAKQCDAMIGLTATPSWGRRSSSRSRCSISATRSVQFETEPQNIVGPRDDITAVTVLSPDEGMKALAEGRADAAFL